MITSNVDQIIGRMVARSQGVQSGLNIAAHRIAPIVERDSKRVLQEDIYDIPEKRSKTGRLLWKRTTDLIAAERGEIEGIDVVLVNRMSYAAARYHLGDYDPGPPTKVSKGGKVARQVRPPQRSTQWQRKAVMMAREFILETRRRAILRVLGASR